MKVHLLGFAYPYQKMLSSINRFKYQACQMGVFDSINVFSDDAWDFAPDLHKHTEYMMSRVPRVGNCLWKFFLLEKMMEKVDENDQIFYVDVGCQFNTEGIERLKDYINIVNEHGSLGFQLVGDMPEKYWTKRDSFDRVNLEEYYWETNILMATCFFLKNISFNRERVLELKEMCIERNYYYIDDRNEDGYVHNPSLKRHSREQSLLSCVMKKYNMYYIDDETYWAPAWTIDGKNYPIWATRSIPK
jgi:hypothetical protein